MGIFSSIKGAIIGAAGKAVGYLEMIGLKYPVRHYMFNVSPTLTRGSRLTEDEGRALASEGFKAVVNLCRESCQEPNSVAGLTHVRIPILDNQVPTYEQVDTFLKTVNDPAMQPAYVHCEAGIGRTGVMCACYRMSVDKWVPDLAIMEFKSFGTIVPIQEAFLRDYASHLPK